MRRFLVGSFCSRDNLQSGGLGRRLDISCPVHLLTGSGGAHIRGGTGQVRVVSHLAGVLVGQLLILAELVLGRLNSSLLLGRQAIAGGQQLLCGLGRNRSGCGGGQLTHELGGRWGIVLDIPVSGESPVRIPSRHRVSLLGNLHFNGWFYSHCVKVTVTNIIARLVGEVVPGFGFLNISYSIGIDLLGLHLVGGHMIPLVVIPLMMMMVVVTLVWLLLLLVWWLLLLLLLWLLLVRLP